MLRVEADRDEEFDGGDARSPDRLLGVRLCGRLLEESRSIDGVVARPDALELLSQDRGGAVCQLVKQAPLQFDPGMRGCAGKQSGRCVHRNRPQHSICKLM